MSDQTPTVSTRQEEHALADHMATTMERKLAENRGKLHWRHPSVDEGYLIVRLVEEVAELIEVVTVGVIDGDAWSEAADVANFAAMLADRQVDNE